MHPRRRDGVDRVDPLAPLDVDFIQRTAERVHSFLHCAIRELGTASTKHAVEGATTTTCTTTLASINKCTPKLILALRVARVPAAALLSVLLLLHTMLRLVRSERTEKEDLLLRLVCVTDNKPRAVERNPLR